MSYPDAVWDVYRAAAGPLVGRFREREETVKADVFVAYGDLLRQVRPAHRGRRPAAAALLSFASPRVLCVSLCASLCLSFLALSASP